MNAGTPIADVQAELERQAKTRRDFIAPLAKVEWAPTKAGEVAILGLPKSPDEGLLMTDWTHGQVAAHFKVPKPYYDRMREHAPDLLAASLNRWRKDEPTTKRMVRTLDGRARAFVSDAYRCLNNLDFALAALPVMREKGAVVVSSQVTDTRLFLKAKCPWLKGEVVSKALRRRGDVIEGGISLRNSEVGDGALDVALYITRVICDNGAIADSILRRAHLGKRQGGSFEEAVEFFSDRTRRLDDAAFFSKVKDMIGQAMLPEFFQTYVDKANGAGADLIPKTADLTEIVEVTLDRFGIGSVAPDIEKVVQHNLITSGDLTRWGVHNAVTAAANEVADYEASTMLEQAGGKIIDLSSDEWTALVKAA